MIATLIVGRTVFDGGFELWRVPLGGGGTMLVARPDCIGVLGSVTADGKTAAVGVTCADVRSGGLHLYDLANGRDTLLQAASSRADGFSGDGRWLGLLFRRSAPTPTPTCASRSRAWTARESTRCCPPRGLAGVAPPRRVGGGEPHASDRAVRVGRSLPPMTIRVGCHRCGLVGHDGRAPAAHNTADHRLWAPRPELAEQIAPSTATATTWPTTTCTPACGPPSTLEEAVRQADVLVMGVPSHGFRAPSRHVARCTCGPGCRWSAWPRASSRAHACA